MLDKLLAFVSGREPVAAATGIAAVVTAGLGLGAAFGLGITAEQIAAVGALAAALAGWAARRAVTPVRPPTRPTAEAGSIPLALIIMIAVGVVLIGGIAVSCDALFEDEQEKGDLGVPVQIGRGFGAPVVSLLNHGNREIAPMTQQSPNAPGPVAMIDAEILQSPVAPRPLGLSADRAEIVLRDHHRHVVIDRDSVAGRDVTHAGILGVGLAPPPRAFAHRLGLPIDVSSLRFADPVAVAVNPLAPAGTGLWLRFVLPLIGSDAVGILAPHSSCLLADPIAVGFAPGSLVRVGADLACTDAPVGHSLVERERIERFGRSAPIARFQGMTRKMNMNKLTSHEYDGGDQEYDQWRNEDRNRNRDRNRGAFSPGPFDDSPVDAFNNVCMPGATCHYDGRGEEPPPEGDEPA